MPFPAAPAGPAIPARARSAARLVVKPGFRRFGPPAGTTVLPAPRYSATFRHIGTPHAPVLIRGCPSADASRPNVQTHGRVRQYSTVPVRLASAWPAKPGRQPPQAVGAPRGAGARAGIIPPGQLENAAAWRPTMMCLAGCRAQGNGSGWAICLVAEWAARAIEPPVFCAAGLPVCPRRRSRPSCRAPPWGTMPAADYAIFVPRRR